MSISDFEQRVLEYKYENNIISLLDATVEYCELHDIDYNELASVIKFTDIFRTTLTQDAKKLHLIKDTETDQLDVI